MRRPIITYFIAVFLLLILVPLLAFLTGTPNLDFNAMGLRAQSQTGIAWPNDLSGVLRMSLKEPGLLLLLLGAFAPTLAAFIAMGRNTQAWRNFLRRFNPFLGPLLPALKRYAVLLAVMSAFLFLVFYIRQFLGFDGLQRRIDVASLALIPALATAAFLDLGGALEEGGWRGFAQVELENMNWSPLKAALLIGIIWGLWHVPRDVIGGVTERYGLIVYIIAYLPSFLLNTVASAFLCAFFMHRLGGSIWPAIMVHGLVNDVWGIAGAASFDQTLSISWQLSKGIPLFIIAVIAIHFWGWKKLH